MEGAIFNFRIIFSKAVLRSLLRAKLESCFLETENASHRVVERSRICDGDGDSNGILNFQGTNPMEKKNPTRESCGPLCFPAPQPMGLIRPTAHTIIKGDPPLEVSQKPENPLCLLSQTLVRLPQTTAISTAKVRSLHRHSHNCITWAQVPDKCISLIWWLFIIQ